MKKPTLYYSDASFKDLAKRVKDAETIQGSTARRMVETMKYDRWKVAHLTKDNEMLMEFASEVLSILYGDDGDKAEFGQALDDLRVICEAAEHAATVTQAITVPATKMINKSNWAATNKSNWAPM